MDSKENITAAGEKVKGSVVTTGTFDGVHIGHREVLSTLEMISGEQSLHPMVVTFDRHPLSTIAPDRAPGLLMLPEERDRILSESGAEVVDLPFDEELRRLTARQWLERLRDGYDARILLLGYDNTFGSDGRGMTLADYARLGRELGVEVLQAPRIEGISSSAIRRALADGDIEYAAGMLGRKWSLTAPVVHGRHVGSALGFPTANMRPDSRLLLPAPGVYAAMARLDNGEEYPAVTNIGYRPSFDDAPGLSVETHIPGIDADLYGSVLTLVPERRLRGERKFDSMQSLRRQIDADVREALQILK